MSNQDAQLHHVYTPNEGRQPEEACPLCRAPATTWRYSEKPGAALQYVVMCDRSPDVFRTRDSLAYGGCVFHMPPNDFYQPTARQAVEHWDDYAREVESFRGQDKAIGLTGPDAPHPRLPVLNLALAEWVTENTYHMNGMVKEYSRAYIGGPEGSIERAIVAMLAKKHRLTTGEAAAILTRVRDNNTDPFTEYPDAN